MSAPRITNLRMRSGRFAPLLLLLGCSQSTEVVSSRDVDGGTEMDAALDAAADGSPEPEAGSDASPEAGPGGDGATTGCKGGPCACDNGLDDDMDGLTDGFDPECTGPLDQDESSFATGYNSGNPACYDCFFDNNPTSQDDNCSVSARCSVDGTSTGAPASCRTCQPLGECVNFCKPRTPNGCDCFGCCELPFEGASVQVKLVDSCSMAVLGDAQRCPPCQLNRECFNPCERCELCAGKPTLPADCGESNACVNGRTCKESAECGAGVYCTQGCCVENLY